MTIPRVLGLAAVVLFATTARLPAQTAAAEMLQRAIRHYDDVEIEDATATLRQIISPTSGLEVSLEERAQVYKYLGAIFALQQGAEQRDSAIAYFSAAIRLNPTVDLEAQSFTPAQRAAFSEARNRTFALAVRPLRPDTLDPSAATITFRCVSSHAGLARAELRSGGVTALVLFDGPGNGPWEITWDGMLPGRTEPLQGRYEMALIGRSSVVSQRDSAVVYFDLQLDPPPEDTLPDLGPQDLLPEVAADSQPIPANVAENQRRQAERTAKNSAIAERNAVALRRAKLVVVPVASGGP